LISSQKVGTLFADETLSISLFILYSAFTGASSPVKLSRVIFQGHLEPVAGLVATRPIPAYVDILSTAGLMACDAPYDFDGDAQQEVDDRLKLSVVTPNIKSLGPDASRITLGPMRFANHDCQPNCEVRPHSSQMLAPQQRSQSPLPQFNVIPQSYLVILMSITDITAGDPITVKYTDDWASYMPGEDCLCASCARSPPKASGSNTPIAPAPTAPRNTNNKRKRKRGLKGAARTARRNGLMMQEAMTQETVVHGSRSSSDD
jgi:hypothetical protein